MRMLAALVLSLTGAIVSARPPAEKDLTAIFQARYSAMKSAMAAHDGNAIGALLAPGFMSEDPDGKTETASSMIRSIEAMAPDPKKSSETTIESVHLAGTTATVRQRYHMTTTKPGADGVPKAVELVAVSTDTWVTVDNTWLLQKTVTERLDYTMEGRPAVHREHSASVGDGKP